MSLTVVDLFCGAGGLSEGFRQAGFKSLVGTDFDPWAGATFTWNHAKHGTKFVLGDLRDRDVKDALNAAIGSKPVDVVVGGPPCQAFSQVRNHQRIIDDPRNSLYREFVQVVADLSPRIFVMENVPGLQSLAGGEVRAQILEDLRIGGRYRVQSQVLDAADYGVPQVRERVIFIGVRSDLGLEPSFPERKRVAANLKLLRTKEARYDLAAAGERFEELKRKLLDDDSFECVTVWQAISDLEHICPSAKLVRKPSDEHVGYEAPPLTAYQRERRRGSSALFNADCPSIRQDTVLRLQAVPNGGNYRDIPEELQVRYLSGQKWGPELGRELLSRKYFFAYRKLHPDYFSWTLNTKADCVFHYNAARALTVREFARLHSFDDTYHFVSGDRHSRYRQVGNAVPPLLAKAIGEAVQKLLLSVKPPVEEVSAAA